MPTSPYNPLTRSSSPGSLSNQPDYLSPAIGVPQFKFHEGCTQGIVVTVSFDKTGDGQVPFQIDDLCFFTHIFPDLTAASQCHDGITAGGQRLGFRLLFIHRQNLSVK